jgi:NAD(P)H-dependent flavin oxidoreductase YrpB (nitropropane dioxygenase family)
MTTREARANGKAAAVPVEGVSAEPDGSGGFDGAEPLPVEDA